MARLGTALQQNLTGYPPEVQLFEQRVNDMQAQLATLPQAEHEAYAGAAATLDVAFRDSRNAEGRQRADEQLSQLGSALLARATIMDNDPVGRALSVFNRPVGGGYLTGLADQQQLGALGRLRQGFVTAATPAAREHYFTQATELKDTLQHRIATAIDQHTTQEAGKWGEAKAEVDRILHEADALTDAPGKRYELIGSQLYSTNPGTGRDDLADRRLLAFTQRMRDDPTLHDKLVNWSVDAGRKLNTYDVDAQKNYPDILNNLPPAGPDYVRDLADQYNAVLHDTSYKNESITPHARAEKLAEQVFEGTARFLLGMTPFAPLTAAFDAHSALSENTRLGIDLASGLVGLVAGEGATAFTERLAAKSATAVVKAGSEGHSPGEAISEAHLPARAIETGDDKIAIHNAPSVQPGKTGAAGVQSTPPAGDTAAQGLRVDEAVAEASQRINGEKSGLPDDYAVQTAPDTLKQAPGQQGVLTDGNGQRYIPNSGKIYPARFDRDNGTWRVYQPNNAYRPQYPVRLDAQGDWKVHSDVGLKGGMNPNDSPPPGLQQARPFGENYRVSTATGAAPSADMLRTLNPESWHSDANHWLENQVFSRRYQTAFDRLPDEQQQALRSWTYVDTSDTYSTGSGYDDDVNYELNQQLRDRTHESGTAARAKVLQTALGGLPRPGGESRLIRIGEVPADYASKLAAGDYVTNSPAFMSAASDSEYAQTTLRDGEFGDAPGSAFALYDIQSKSATPFVHRVTTLALGENEWLFRPNTLFRVDEMATATSQDGSTTPRIGLRLSEVPIESPTFAKNIYTGEQELVYPQGTTPVYAPLQATRTPPVKPSPPTPNQPPPPAHGDPNQPGPFMA